MVVAHIAASSPNEKISSEKTIGRIVIASSLSKKLKGRRQAIGRIWMMLNSKNDVHAMSASKALGNDTMGSVHGSAS